MLDHKPAASGHGVPPNAVYNYWKEFDLETMRGKLDEKGMSIAEYQELSVKSRKHLAEKTKEFRANVTPEIFKQLSPLLKLYQQEVDALTSRAKLGESSFLDVFKLLYDAPDPAPTIASGLELASRATDLETQIVKITSELAEYKAESKELKNQDLTIRRLEERVRSLEAELLEKDAEVEEARQEAATELESRNADDAREREARLEAELTRAEAALEAMRRMHHSTQAQLFSVQEKGEEAAAAARAEAEFATAEVERAESMLAQLAQQRDALLEKMKDAPSSHQSISTVGNSLEAGSGTNVAHVTALREELKLQRDIVVRLESELSHTKHKTTAQLATMEARAANLQVTLQATEAHAAALEAELAGRPTMYELEDARQQIRVLRAVVHNSVGEDDDESDVTDQQLVPGVSGSDKNGREDDAINRRTTTRNTAVGSLEKALLLKNRHLEHTLTMARLEAAEARTAAAAATSSLVELETEVERQKELIAKLEDDLVSAETAAGLTPHCIPESRESEEGGVLTESSAEALPGGTACSGGSEQTMLSVLSGQRDRLRGRVRELETQMETATQALEKARKDMEASRADNIALVERLRYVQGYARAGGDVEAGTAAVNRYIKEYEDRVNPFTDFREKERAARRRQMPIQDRAAYAVGSAFVSGNKIARSAIVVYAFVLHLIAFVVLAGFSSRHVDKLDALEEMCGQLHSGIGSGSNTTSSSSANVDPVVGGGMATVVQETVGRRLLTGVFNYWN